MMKAIVQNDYGAPDVLKLKEMPMPELKEHDLLVKVNAVGLNAGDYFSMRGSPWLARFTVGFPKPKDYILGWDVVGVVEAVGEQVTRFKPGDEIFAVTSAALAEYAAVNENHAALKPTNFSNEQTAAMPSAALTALIALRDQGKIQAGQKVLINGASGGVGTFAVQIAKAFDTEVTGVCSTRNLGMVRSLGADHVFDYKKEDFTRSGQQYDLILDNVASRTFTDLFRVLAPGGVVVPNSGHGGMTYVFKALLRSTFGAKVAGLFMAEPNPENMDFLKELAEAGKLTPVIDKTYPLAETPDALRYLTEEHAQGKVVVYI
ncbi:MAG: NAD(P)-dependent alcohol dehydrogenase [Anaerolineales bacterium]|nr:NAD(P)-dependent alcohol dehydrogenase [Anaerolineales bacterium]